VDGERVIRTPAQAGGDTTGDRVCLLHYRWKPRAIMRLLGSIILGQCSGLKAMMRKAISVAITRD